MKEGGIGNKRGDGDERGGSTKKVRKLKKW